MFRLRRHVVAAPLLVAALLAAMLLPLAVGGAAEPTASPPVSDPPPVDFLRDVRPILVQRCYRCHSSLKQEGGLRLDGVQAIRQGGERGALYAAGAKGRSSESLLLRAVLGDGDLRMPPEGEPLAAAQVDTLRRWLEQGGPLPADDAAVQHWSFVPPRRPSPPSPARAEWVRNPIDAFVAAGHERHRLRPSAEAPRHVLLRRVYLDLTGLPPTADEMRAFLADRSPDAYERTVERLLDSPAYGERWGRHWMDVWRYSDWDGYGKEVRESQPHIWRWRDWILESLNADAPYDQMIVQMLAGDELAPDDPATLRATGYLVRSWYKFSRHVWLDQAIEHTGKAFLGVTFNCARCHDHMYDPIPQADYYRLRAVFEPYDVRTDRLPGQPDPQKDGLVRVFDKNVAAETFVFVRGDEKQPDKDQPARPAIPKIFGGRELAAEPIALPVAAYYPGSQTFVQEETLAAARAELTKAEAAVPTAREAVTTARKKLEASRAAHESLVKKAKTPGAAPDADEKKGADEKQLDKLLETKAATAAPMAPMAATAALKSDVLPVADPAAAAAAVAVDELAVAKAEAALVAAEQAVAVAHAAVPSVEARIAADRAVYSQPPAAAEEIKKLALAAGRSERLLAVAQTELNVRLAQSKLDDARRALKPNDEKLAKAVTTAETAHAAAVKARDDARAAVDKPQETYAPLGAVGPKTSSGRRLALARWIASDTNPLTARVAVNQLWLRHFGAPLVPTVFDFGANGKPPTDPELLDWLACELIEQGWRTKPLHRLMVTSAAYRQASVPSVQGVDGPWAGAAEAAADPDNRRLWRMNARRMEAELVRDGALHVADQLDRRMYGEDLDPQTGLTSPRRSVYFRTSKEKKVTFLALFDSPNPVECYQRPESIAPQQALAMANSPLTLAQARRLAGRLSAELDAPPNGASNAAASSVAESNGRFIAAAFEQVLARPASDAERVECLRFLDEQARRFENLKTMTPFVAAANAVKPSDVPRQRARENLVHVLFNHNDFVTVR